MAYAKEVLHRAEARLDEARRQNDLDCDRRISAIYEKLPRLREIDRELRKTSAKVYAAAFCIACSGLSLPRKAAA